MGMKSLTGVYRIGRGPSSSHTMGPSRAAELFHSEYPDADHYEVTLYGSLALTGAGHMTDRAVLDALGEDRTEIVWNTRKKTLPHPNTMDLKAFKDGREIGTMRALSIGGGAIRIVGRDDLAQPEVYRESSFAEIARYCKDHRKYIWEYVYENEGQEIFDYLEECWQVMKQSVEDGLSTSGVLPGGLGVDRRAQHLYGSRHIDESESTKENRIVCAYAFAVAEQNADAGVIVTAPTCGSCGVVPAALLYMQKRRGFTDEKVVQALATGGIIGNLIKTNASVSGAECGCQAEIGSACSMCAAALGELFEMGIDQIEYAAEIAMEHHLGLTCDPIRGLVQIPCIERNAVAAMRAINALSLANFLTDSRKISFDMVVETMYETGKDLNIGYRETSTKGLAKLYPGKPTAGR